MVIKNHPRLPDGSPFATLFWLTCPLLVKRASRLESEGWMSELGERLDADAQFQERFAAAIARYRERRDQHERIATGSPPGGGPQRVKCLHAHLAHELADPPNPVGGLTLARTGWPDCVAACVPEASASAPPAPAK
jgi:hypothetical protein